jgi:hypothetical protein
VAPSETPCNRRRGRSGLWGVPSAAVGKRSEGHLAKSPVEIVKRLDSEPRFASLTIRHFQDGSP